MSVVTPLVRITAWSHSRLETYKACPYRAKKLYVEKVKEPDSGSAAALRGTRVHALGAVYVSKRLPSPISSELVQFLPEMQLIVKTGKLPVEFARFALEMEALRAAGAVTEAEWAFDNAWQPTGWFAYNAWCRAKVDVHVLVNGAKRGARKINGLRLVDYKTGKYKDDHDLQRSLYALQAFHMYADVEYVEAAHWYLDSGERKEDKWTRRGDLAKLQKEWDKRITAMLNDTTFAPKPGDHCRWCTFARGKGGDCEF